MGCPQKAPRHSCEMAGVDDAAVGHVAGTKTAIDDGVQEC
jgi:hypothetical protein